MKKATLVSLAILMFLSVPSYAGFVLHPVTNHVSFTAPVGNDKPDNKDAAHSKKSGLFGILSISAAVIGCICPASLAVMAIVLGAGAIVLGAMGRNKKKRKLRGLAIAGIILGAIAVLGGIILLAI